MPLEIIRGKIMEGKIMGGKIVCCVATEELK